MKALTQTRVPLILSFIISILLIATSVTLAHATGPCADGSAGTLATQAQADSASPAGSIVAGVTPVCPNDVRLGISNSVGSAKDYLKTLSSGSATTQAANFTMLNDTFAVCAANFLKAFQQKYTPVKITSAGRTQAEQLSVCPNAIPGKCGGSNSNHTKGLALDVVPSDQNYQQMWAFAKSNPQFGVCFPFESGDRVHMILQGIPGSGEADHCTTLGYGNKPCSGAPVSSYNTPTVAKSPTASLSNSLCSLSGSCTPQSSACVSGYVLDSYGNCVQQTTAQCAPGYVQSNGTCFALASQSGAAQQMSAGMSGSSGSGGSSGYTSSAGTTGTTGSTVSNTGTTGSTISTTGTTGSTISTPSSTINPVSSLLTNTNTNSNKNITATSTGTSTADLLRYYMNLATNKAATSTSTTTPLVLNSNTTDISTLSANTQPNQATVTYTSSNDGSNPAGSTNNTAGTASGTSGDTIVTIQPTSTTGQTFTSQNLTNSGGTNNTSAYSPSSLSFAQQTLASLKGILQQILSYLTPFGGLARQQAAE